jgi:catechol 2,3-dioxygenase
MTDTAAFFDMQAAPMRIGTVRLKVRDPEAVAAFYQRVLGLGTIEARDSRVVLGSGATPLLELEGDANLARRDPRQAGLFHTAFLMPTRGDLARWLAHAAAAKVPLHGASDHIVSEAIYLADPEGNGIEVYADRPLARWREASGELRMATDPLDLQDLLRQAGDRAWTGFPAGGSIGHVHLQVGDTEAADRFYRDVLGFDIAARYPGASFYGSGGYHHQLAGNVWNSRRAGQRPDGMAGLDSVGIILRDAATLDGIGARAAAAGLSVARSDGALSLPDPWGTRITLTV